MLCGPDSVSFQNGILQEPVQKHKLIEWFCANSSSSIAAFAASRDSAFIDNSASSSGGSLT